jgi:hypothetical protein
LRANMVQLYYLLDEAFELLGERLFGDAWRGEEKSNLRRPAVGAGDILLSDPESRTRCDVVEQRLLEALASGQIVAILPGSEEKATVPDAYWSKRQTRKAFEPRGYSIELSQLMPTDCDLYLGPVTVGISKQAFDQWLRTSDMSEWSRSAENEASEEN